MKQVLSYLKYYIKESILGPLFKLFEALFDLFVPLVMAAMIDKGIANRDTDYVLKMCGLLVLLAAIGLAVAITAQWFASVASAGVAKRVKHDLFVNIEKLSFADIDKFGPATLITRMTSDMNQIQSGINMMLRLLLRSPFIVFGAMVMAFTIDVNAAIVFVVIIPLLAAVVLGITIWCIPRYKLVQGALDKVLQITRENLTGVRVIRAFTKEKEETEEFEGKNDELTALNKHVGRVSALLNPVTYVMINVATAVLIWVCGDRVNTGSLTQGQTVALVNYMAQILVELIKLANMIVTLTKTAACADRVCAVMNAKSSMPVNVISDEADKKLKKAEVLDFDKEVPKGSSVEFKNVSLNYSGKGDNALEAIDFVANPGETIGIIGGTGSGKSSLVNLIPRFYDTTDGKVLVAGENVRDYDLHDLRGKIGVVPQKAVLFTGTIRDNMKWGNPDATDDEIMEAVKAAQALDVIRAKEDGLDSYVTQGGRNLSGGQRQRLTIARALVKNPDILILDDSASALDFATDAALRRSLKELAGNPSVFIVSQRAASVMHADKIIVLDEGRIAGIGTNDELLKSCDVYKEIYDSQFSNNYAGKEAV